MGEKFNWRELIQEAVGRGDDMDCLGIECEDCIFNPAKDKEECAGYFPFTTTEDEERLTLIHRHLLITVRDWNDFDEIRAHLAEMLDDPEKFLGRAEVQPEYPYRRSHDHVGYGYQYGKDSDPHRQPELLFYIVDNETSAIIAAFRDEATRDHVQEFLNENLEKQ